MAMTYELSFENNPCPNDIQILGNAIMHNATQKKGFKPLDFFAFFIRDEDKKIMGGCNGSTLYGCLYIDQLWVNDSLRHQGFGTQLMLAAEQYGKEKGCTFATVNTMDWEALDFYKKLGFSVEFARRGFLKNSTFYFLRKEFRKAETLARSQEKIIIRPFLSSDITNIVDQFSKHHWPKLNSTFETYWCEQSNQERQMWLAFYEEQFAGYVTLKWSSLYPSFKEQNIPEIMDLNVLPPYRYQGIATALLDIAEKKASQHSPVVGLGVGLYRDYGSAQRLYIKRGYLPDGLGITYNYKSIEPGKKVTLDDDLILWFTKKLT
ncbi:GNAT family N-acetyltransferase [Legionella brunensis]|uniref:GNAT family acetyltransferase n=1 Tax=Legionella brunensis TaxID=29422 RepID=A0A0W0SM85_9GAMM|nr:GNAT family N-acetyltransferase [Legionella brunensis]KTC84496.1 GNAT family acetyltransferase [Legionella brunensis]